MAQSCRLRNGIRKLIRRHDRSALRLITSGVACWLTELHFEGHAAYARDLHKFRVVDVVLPWLLADCGVNVTLKRYYPKYGLTLSWDGFWSNCLTQI